MDENTRELELSKLVKSKDYTAVVLALACMLLTTTLMNAVVFPHFDSVFTYARDLSVLASTFSYLLVGVLAWRCPKILYTTNVTGIVIGMMAVGGIILMPSLVFANPIGVTVGAGLLAMGRSWVTVLVGMAASRLPLPYIAAGISVAFVAFYFMTAIVWVIPSLLGLLLFLFLPFISLALTNNKAKTVFEAIDHNETPHDLSVVQPSSFLSLGSQLFVCLFIFRIAFGYSLRFGEVGGVPMSDFLVIIPVAIVALVCLLSKRELSPDLLVRISLVVVVAGFLVGGITFEYSPMTSITLLSAGNALFDIVAWTALVSVAARNEHGAVAVFAWGKGVTTLGSIFGAELGVFANGLVQSNHEIIDLLNAIIVLVIVGYALIGMNNFSFKETIKGVSPVSTQTALAPEDRFEISCSQIASQYSLSPRELEVLKMMARGRDRTYIQEQMGVSRNTVKAHVSHVYAKLGIHNHQELIDTVEQALPMT